jgi:hypothetical protein
MVGDTSSLVITLSQHITERTEAMHNMKKLILPVFIFTFGFATATHAQQVNTLLTKQLPEAPGKEIEVITVFSTGKLRCKFVEARFAGLVAGRYFTNHLKTFIP